jgi:hypothetical protein
MYAFFHRWWLKVKRRYLLPLPAYQSPLWTPLLHLLPLPHTVTPLRPVPPPPRRRQLEQPLSVFQQSILSSIQKEKENTLAVDEDEHFMLSLVPSLRRLSNQKRAQARMRMQQVLYDVEFGE